MTIPLSSETVSVLVVGLLMGLAEFSRRRREKDVVKAASNVETKTDQQTGLLTETLGAVVAMGRDVSDIKRNADGLVSQVGGLTTAVDRLEKGHKAHGERIGDLEKAITKVVVL